MLSTLILLAAVLSTGCATSAKRQDAARLADKVTRYRTTQQERIKQLNRDYQLNYARLMKQLDLLCSHEIDQSLDLEAMRVSEALIRDWEVATLPKNLRDSLKESLDHNVAAIQTAEAEMQRARDTYAASYKEAVLQLKKLEDVESQLKKLATTPKEREKLSELLNTLYTLYQQSQKKNDAGGKEK